MIAGYDGVKVFSATHPRAREMLGETMADWTSRHTEIEIAATEVMQSSDATYHCLTIVVFFRSKR